VLINMSLHDFLQVMGSESSTPGGGSASAGAGAMAAALLTKVCRLTMGREKYLADDTLVRAVLAEAEGARLALMDLVDRDTAAYNQIIAARALPQTTDVQKRCRGTALRQAFIQATDTPLAVVRHSAKVQELAQSLVGRVNHSTASDVGVAALLAYSAIEGAAMTVEMNLPHIHDSGYVQQTRQNLEILRRKTLRRSRSLDTQMNDWLTRLQSM
jgi:methenyltetrahydrofolate cyclohydrolase